MATNSKNKMRHAYSGFTIVELLIVIVIIGILAAITIVAYNGIQDRANNTAVQSDLNAFAKKIIAESAESGAYPMPTAAMGIKITKSAYQTTQNNLYFCRNVSTNEFALSARTRSGKQYKYTNTSGLSEHATTLYGSTTCELIGLPIWSGTYGSVGYDSADTVSPWESWAL